MKIITISKIGYNAPAQANWCYGIWKIDTIDTSQGYCMSYTVKEAFGGDSRLKDKVKKELGVDIIEVKGIYTKTGTPKITGISTMLAMEGEEVFKELKDFITDNN